MGDGEGEDDGAVGADVRGALSERRASDGEGGEEGAAAWWMGWGEGLGGFVGVGDGGWWVEVLE